MTHWVLAIAVVAVLILLYGRDIALLLFLRGFNSSREKFQPSKNVPNIVS
jgi:hypothetical protein